MSERRVIVDTDTAGDDTQAIVLAVLSDRIDLEGLTIVAGNVEFEYQVENAKYTLDLAGKADVPVYEGATQPLHKDYEYASYVHGEGGLGGDLFPDTGIPSADEHAVDFILDTVRESPGEVSLLCVGPLTNVAMALQREPDLDELVDEVWVMGGAVNALGNVTPAAEYNFWVDPDAARDVMSNLDTYLVDWELSLRRSLLTGDKIDAITEADTPYAEFFAEISESVREFTREMNDVDGTTQPDSLTVAAFAYPELVTETGTYFVDVDDREGMTRGYSMVDENGVTDGEPRTTVVEDVDGERFEQLFSDVITEGDPDASFED